MFFLGARRRVPVEPTPPVEPTVVEVLEQRADEALRLIHQHLAAQHVLEPDDRDDVLCDLMLDLRNILQPGVWKLPLRQSVPVIPGREP